MFESADPAALRERFVALQASISAQQAEAAAVLAEIEATGAYVLPDRLRGSLVGWVREATRCSPSEAYRLVRRARTLAALPELGGALQRAETTSGHVDVIAQAVPLLPPESLGDLEMALVDAAICADVRDVERLMKHLRHRVDPDGATAAAMAAEERAGLSVSPYGSDGMVAINGLLTALDGAALIAALEPLSAPSGDDDKRSVRQRKAAALGELARRQLAQADLPMSGGLRPQVTVVVPLSTLLGQAGAPAAHLVDGMPLDRATTQAICCDAEITRLLHDDTGATAGPDPAWLQQLVGTLPPPLAAAAAILDLGRSQRTANAHLRRALNFRDGGCVRPGCRRKPAWCEAHHLREWVRDSGPTNLDDLALLCTEHHHELHRLDLRLVRAPNGTWHLVDRDDGLDSGGGRLAA